MYSLLEVMLSDTAILFIFGLLVIGLIYFLVTYTENKQRKEAEYKAWEKEALKDRDHMRKEWMEYTLKESPQYIKDEYFEYAKKIGLSGVEYDFFTKNNWEKYEEVKSTFSEEKLKSFESSVERIWAKYQFYKDR